MAFSLSLWTLRHLRKRSQRVQPCRLTKPRWSFPWCRAARWCRPARRWASRRRRGWAGRRRGGARRVRETGRWWVRRATEKQDELWSFGPQLHLRLRPFEAVRSLLAYLEVFTFFQLSSIAITDLHHWLIRTNQRWSWAGHSGWLNRESGHFERQRSVVRAPKNKMLWMWIFFIQV